MKKDLCKVMICVACVAAVGVDATVRSSLGQSSADVRKVSGSLAADGKRASSGSADLRNTMSGLPRVDATQSVFSKQLQKPDFINESGSLDDLVGRLEKVSNLGLHLVIIYDSAHAALNYAGKQFNKDSVHDISVDAIRSCEAELDRLYVGLISAVGLLPELDEEAWDLDMLFFLADVYKSLEKLEPELKRISGYMKDETEKKIQQSSSWKMLRTRSNDVLERIESDLTLIKSSGKPAGLMESFLNYLDGEIDLPGAGLDRESFVKKYSRHQKLAKVLRSQHDWYKARCTNGI